MPKKLTLEEFIEKAIEIHGNKYNYSRVVYFNAKTKVCIICPIHGEFWQTPDNHLNGKSCPNCSHQSFPYTTKKYIEKCKNIHNNKYGYDNTIYNNSWSKIIATCFEHGNFEINASSHLQGIGCPECGLILIANKLSSNKDEFIQKAIQIHGDKYDYSSINYINSWTKVCIICPEHGEFWVTPNNHLNQKSGCPVCKSSKGESTIKEILDKHKIISIREWKHPDEKYLYEYDFYLPDHNLLIEFHGKQHYDYIPYFHKTYHGFELQRLRDSNKITLAKAKKIPLLEFNYKQLDNLSTEQFEQLILNNIKNRG